MKEQRDSEVDRLWTELYREAALQRMLLRGGAGGRDLPTQGKRRPSPLQNQKYRIERRETHCLTQAKIIMTLFFIA